MHKIFLSLLILLYLGSWQLVDGGPTENSIALMDSTDQNPNGSSELSLLMRDMFNHAATARKLALSDEKDPDFPEKFKKIFTATPTDSETKNSHYDTFANIYLNAGKTYSSSNTEDLKVNYNNLVNTCLACHSTHCPGPVPKIKKLLIP
ncbi:MAG TPA: hypothetical protein PKM97_02670 [Bacteroidia bacterium]|nr:hypothetical protein [Bacteroidia bacterium]